MVSPCANNGPAQAIPGSGLQVVLTSAAVESTLVLLGLEPVAAALGPILAGVTFDLTTLCGNDPPADPGLTGSDVIAATAFYDPINQASAIQKVYQWFKHFYWYYACECVSGSTPAVPTPSNPGNPISQNTGLPYSTTAQTCWDQSANVAIGAGNGTTGPSLMVTTSVLPSTKSFTTPQLNNGTPIVAQVIPPGVVAMRATVSCSDTLTQGGITFAIQWYDNAGNFVQPIQSASFGATDAFRTATYTQSVPATAYAWSASLSNNDPHAHTPTIEVSYTCTGGTQIFQQPCCPPDPALQSQLAQMMQLLQAIYSGLPVTLRSYAESTVHNGLSGNGSVTLGTNVLAVKVDITTDPSSLGLEPGTPSYLFDRGYIVPITAEAPIRQEARLVYNPQMFPLPAITERIGYSLAPGVVVTITELIAGP